MDTKLVARQVRLQKWAAIIADCHKSGLPVAHFCKQHNISYHAYYYWLHLVREAACNELSQNVEKSPAVFAPVPFKQEKFTSTNRALTLHFADFSLDINESVSPEFLKSTLLLLRQMSSQC